MHNFWMNIRRYKALVLAVLPFLISSILWGMFKTAEGYAPIGVMLIWIASMPIQAAMSISSVFYAFSKEDPERRWAEAARVVSVISVLVFGGLTLFGAIGAITSIMGLSLS